MKVRVSKWSILKYFFCTILKGSPTNSLPVEVSVERSAWMLCQLPLQLMLPVWPLLDCFISWLKTDGGLEGALMQSGVFQRLNWTFMMQIYSNCITHLIRYDFIILYMMYIVTDIWWHVWCVFTFLWMVWRDTRQWDLLLYVASAVCI